MTWDSKNPQSSRGSASGPPRGLAVLRRTSAVVQQHCAVADESGPVGKCPDNKVLLNTEHCKDKQNSLHQLNLQHKAFSVFYKMVGVFSPPYYCNLPNNSHQQSLPLSFNLHISSPYLFTKSSIQSHCLPRYPSHFSLPNFYIQSPSIFSTTPIKNLFSTWTIRPVEAAARSQWASAFCLDWHCFDLSLIPGNMYRKSNTHYHWFLITGTHNIGVWQVPVIRMVNVNHTLNLLSFLSYPIDTITSLDMPPETSFLKRVF